MTDPAKNTDGIPNKLSRRNLLRNSVITTAGVVLLPPFLTGCRKDVWQYIHEHGGHGGVGDTPLTSAELKLAAGNLNRMRALIADLYDVAFKYDEVVLLALASTKENPSWTNFIVNVVIEIAIAMASAAAVASGTPLAVPAIACLSAFLHDWGIGKGTPEGLNGLNGFFSEYQAGQLAMAQAIDEKLGFLTDENRPANDYKNLQEAWKDPIVFNDTSYTLADLAASYFPEKNDNSVDYHKIYDAMYEHHRRSVWNLAS